MQNFEIFAVKTILRFLDVWNIYNLGLYILYVFIIKYKIVKIMKKN